MSVNRHFDAKSPGFHRSVGGRGFTLIELVLVIGLLVLLLVLALPSLQSVRDSARRVVTLSNLRQHASVVSAYCADAKDLFPQITDPAVTLTILRGGGLTIAAEYFDACHYWPLPLASGYYDGSIANESFRDPRNLGWNVSDYKYSHTCYTRPEFWNSETRVGPVQWRGVRSSEVKSPSAKGIFLNFFQYSDPAVDFFRAREVKWEIAFADGHAAAHLGKNLIPAYQASSVWPGMTLWWHSVLGTPDGVRGRDIR
jgi:prepilin-type N-terminal cleavage/methylation domain-containing protein